MTNQVEKGWHDDENISEEVDPLHQYDLMASPNDFNISTLFSFIESGTVKIPTFQRNYVWDIKYASKLIESIVLGLPIPQIFLYEEARNKFLVIDGQQRLMSIYYFIKERFPKMENRTHLRQIFDKNGKIPDGILEDDNYFAKFKLTLPQQLPNQRNQFNDLTYSTLSDYRSTFDLRTIRSVIVKQVSPKDGDSAIYEIFNRLNSGGVNLTQQEIRMSLYHSDFYNMLYRINIDKRWRGLTGISDPDIHMKDLEFLVRGFAMLINGQQYKPSMVKFLNLFSFEAKKYNGQEIKYLEDLFVSFLDSCSNLKSRDFERSSQRFSITLFESIFVAACQKAYDDKRLLTGKITADSVAELKSDTGFREAAEKTTTNTDKVSTRLERAREIIKVE